MPTADAGKAEKERRSAETQIEGRPKRRRLSREEREIALLDAAFREFAASGYEGASLGNVAARAGVTKGLILFYFKSKEALFDAVVRNALSATLFELLGELLVEDGAPAGEMFASLIKLLYDRLVCHEPARELLRIIVAEGPKFPAISEIYYQQMVNRAAPAIQRIVDHGIATGEFSPAAANIAPLALHGLMVTPLTWTLMFGRSHPLDFGEMMRSQIDLALNGLRGPR